MKFPPFPLFYGQPIKKIDFFHYPRVSAGALPLTKKPVDSGYEIEETAESVVLDIHASTQVDEKIHFSSKKDILTRRQ